MKTTPEFDFKKMFEDLFDPMLIRDKNDKIIFVNKAALALFDYNNSEMIGKEAIELLVPDDLRSGYRKFFSMLINNEQNAGRIQEKNLLGKHNKELVLESSTSVIKIHGEPYVINTYKDITDRKHIEEKFKEFQEMFFTITNSARDAIIMINNKGLVTYWNPAAEKIFGYSSLEVIDKDIHYILAPSRYHEVYKSNFKKFAKTGQGNAIDKIIELEAIRKDGVEIPIELSVSSVKISNEWNAIGIIRDITERKENEQNINDLVSIYKKVLETLDYDFVILDPTNHEVSIINGYIDSLQTSSCRKKTCYEMIFDKETPCEWCKLSELNENQVLKHTIHFPEENCNCDFLFLSFTINNKPHILCRMKRISNI